SGHRPDPGAAARRAGAWRPRPGRLHQAARGDLTRAAQAAGEDARTARVIGTVLAAGNGVTVSLAPEASPKGGRGETPPLLEHAHTATSRKSNGFTSSGAFSSRIWP